MKLILFCASRRYTSHASKMSKTEKYQRNRLSEDITEQNCVEIDQEMNAAADHNGTIDTSMRGEGQLDARRGVRAQLIERVKADVAQILQKFESDIEAVRLSRASALWIYLRSENFKIYTSFVISHEIVYRIDHGCAFDAATDYKVLQYGNLSLFLSGKKRCRTCYLLHLNLRRNAAMKLSDLMVSAVLLSSVS